MKPERWHILIVDDDENDRLLLRRSLKKSDSQIVVTEAKDGVEAIEYLDGKGKFASRNQHPFPTLILVDLKMPRLDGLAVLEHLKKNDRWAIIPTIVFSASADLDDIKKAFLCGAAAYHVKPQKIDDRDSLCRKLMDYWRTTEVPETDGDGHMLETNSQGKLGERIKQP